MNRIAQAVAVAAALIATSVASSPAQATVSDFTPTANMAQRWVATNGASDQTVTQAQAEAIARRFEVIVARQRTFGPYLAAMRAVKPSVVVLVYLNGAFSGPEEVYPESWYAHDAEGNRLYSVKWGRYLMDVGNPAWADAVATECAEDLVSSGYDGCYLDMLGDAPLSEGYVSTLPVNPATGTVWTPSDYISATSAIGAKAKQVNADSIVVGNGLANGRSYFDSTAATVTLLNGLDGGNAEGWIRGANQDVNQFRREADWKKDVDMVVDAGARGKTVLAMTKVWVTATQAEIDRWHKFALASFLLGNDGNSYFSFYSDLNRQSMAEASTPHRWDDVDVGRPLGPYAKKRGVYRRDFTNGISLVNPTTSNVTVRLGGSYRDLEGVVRSRVTLMPNTAEVFRRS